MQSKTAVLLVNLGTPISPDPADVRQYLIEFLTDGRVIDVPWLWRQFLVRRIIVPKRYKQSAKCYKDIWTKEGSPLMVYGNRVKEALQNVLGNDFHVELGMRYQKPSIAESLKILMEAGPDHLLVLPLFPQYASATTGSVHEKVMHELKSYPIIPQVTLINNFAEDPGFIHAFSAVASAYPIQEYDHILFSYHGLPEKQLKKADPHGLCLTRKDCCSRKCAENRNCYSAQCNATTRGIVKALGIQESKYSICYQSRLGKDPWIQPYATEVIAELAKQGKKHVLVFCPSFVCDCLETIYEFGVEYAWEFQHAGGEKLDYVRGLNEHPAWIDALKNMVLKNWP